MGFSWKARWAYPTCRIIGSDSDWLIFVKLENLYSYQFISSKFEYILLGLQEVFQIGM